MNMERIRSVPDCLAYLDAVSWSPPTVIIEEGADEGIRLDLTREELERRARESLRWAERRDLERICRVAGCFAGVNAPTWLQQTGWLRGGERITVAYAWAPLTDEAEAELDAWRWQSSAVRAADARAGDDTAAQTITAAVAEKRYGVSRRTIREAVRDGRLRDLRPEGHAPNAPLLVDEREVASRWLPEE